MLSRPWSGTMKVTQLAKDKNSVQAGDCPAVHVAPEARDLLVIQGKRPDPDTMGNLTHLAADETAVVIPVETVFRAVEAYVTQYGRPV
jgi:hypothetical protein